MCCSLIRLGHAQVWDYPWGVYLAAMRELDKNSKGIKR